LKTFQVSIPVGGDQLVNGKEYERLGVGASIAFTSLTEENLSEAVNKVLSEPSYKIR
jgi:UDP:flavonoid glycosyltransferase YjiC (YdhE family)